MYEYAVTTKRIAVIAPDASRTGGLRSAIALAQALYSCIQKEGADVEIVLAYPEDSRYCAEDTLAQLVPQIKVRAFNWIKLDRDTARRAMLYAGHSDWTAREEHYCAPDDGIKQFCDCDLWVLASDRVPQTLLPVRPSVIMTHGYVQRYEPMWRADTDLPWLTTARQARALLVTSRTAAQDAQNYAAVAKESIFEVPLLISGPEAQARPATPTGKTSFLWVVNEAESIDQTEAFSTLKAYYQTYGGTMPCRIAGIAVPKQQEDETDKDDDDKTPSPWQDLFAGLMKDGVLKDKINFLGSITDEQLEAELSAAAFLWHTDLIDNEALITLAAHRAGLPVLARDFVSMRELDTKLGLGMIWGPRKNPRVMAKQLKAMEPGAAPVVAPAQNLLPPPSIESVADAYWKVVRSCL